MQHRHSTSAQGLLLLFAGGIALVWANSAWSAGYHSLCTASMASISLRTLINDGLMTLFFFSMALAIKQRVMQGGLKEQLLPLWAALGGVVCPALLYGSLTWSEKGALQGWPIPTATDIALASTCLLLFGRRIVPQAQTFLLTLAMADDVVAILLMALLQRAHINLLGAAIALGLTLLILLLSFTERLQRAPCLLLGALLWGVLQKSHITPTLAGVICGLAVNPRQDEGFPPALEALILALFAFVNAGVNFTDWSPTRVTLATTVGLCVGKPLGILWMSALAVKSGQATYPPLNRATWWGVACLGGVGFTLSMLFSEALLSDQRLQQGAKAGVVFGSTLSAVMGMTLLGQAACASRKERVYSQHC